MSAWPAPAKLNLFLHITGRRADGYHTLQSVFQFLDFGDRLDFIVTDSGAITRARPLAGVSESDDLCLCAARLLQQKAGISSGVVIDLDKRLPMGGGLGGGSSDAATVLTALNQLWRAGLDTEDLAALGLELGADVPVFVRGEAAWAEGVGELLTPVSLPEPWFVVICPDVVVSTAKIFADPELTRASPAITIRAFREGETRNALEAVVRRRHPEVDQAYRWLSRFGAVRMTGSGGCLFLDVASRAEGEEILVQCPADLSGFVARARNRSPLVARLDEEVAQQA